MKKERIMNIIKRKIFFIIISIVVITLLVLLQAIFMQDNSDDREEPLLIIFGLSFYICSQLYYIMALIVISFKGKIEEGYIYNNTVVLSDECLFYFKNFRFFKIKYSDIKTIQKIVHALLWNRLYIDTMDKKDFKIKKDKYYKIRYNMILTIDNNEKHNILLFKGLKEIDNNRMDNEIKLICNKNKKIIIEKEKIIEYYEYEYLKFHFNYK